MGGEHGLVTRHRLTPGDLAQLAVLAGVCSQDEGRDLSFAGEMAAAYSGALPQPLWFEHGRLVGGAGLQGPDEEVEVAVLVHPGHRRHGVGHSLLKTTIAACRQHAIEEMLLVCAAGAPSGEAFAKAMGAGYRYSEYRMALVAAPHAPRHPSPTPGYSWSRPETSTHSRG